MLSLKTRIRKIALIEAIHHGTVTRKTIIQMTDVRPATVTDVVRSLLEEGVLEEDRQPDQSSGRRASPLYLRGEYGCFLGIALDVDQIRLTLRDAANVERAALASGKTCFAGSDAIFKEIESLTKKIRQQAGKAPWEKLCAIGFADPGLTDEGEGRSIRAVNLPGWENMDTARRLENMFKKPVLVRPEMSARAYAERLLEQPPDGGGCFHLNLNRGVGGAYTCGLEPFRGDHHCQMEIGHVIIEENGPLCQCGNHGCLEALTGRAGVKRRVARLREEKVDSLLTEAPFSWRHFIECAQKGDKMALRLTLETAENLGKALAAAVSLLNPARVSLSGPFFQLREEALPVIRRELSLRCMPQMLDRLEMVVSELGNEAPALGAALIARHHYLMEKAKGK